MKPIYILLFFLFISKGFSQKFSGMFSIDLDKTSKVYASIDKNKSNIILCFLDKEKIQTVLLDENTSLINTINTESFPDYNTILTSNTSNKKAKIVWTNPDLSSFLIQSFDFNTNEASSKTYFNNKDKKILQVFFNNDELEVLAVSSIDKNLSITSISNEGAISENTIKLENNAQNTINNLLNYTYIAEKNKFPLVIIKENEHNSFTETHSPSKCYLKNDSVLISLDKNPDETEILSINIKDKTATTSFIKREKAENIISYNSLMVDNNIFQVEQSKTSTYLSLKNLEGNLIKKFSEKDFQNSKYFAEYELGKIGEIESKNYFKKVNNKELGISYTKSEGNLYLTIGSPINARMPIDEDDNQQNSSVMIGALAGGLAGGLIGLLIYNSTSSPNMDNFGGFITKGQIFNQLIIDSNHSVLPSFKKEFSFNKLKTEIVNSNSYSAPVIFMMKDSYYLGFYANKEKRYFLKRFKN